MFKIKNIKNKVKLNKIINNKYTSFCKNKEQLLLVIKPLELC